MGLLYRKREMRECERERKKERGRQREGREGSKEKGRGEMKRESNFFSELKGLESQAQRYKRTYLQVERFCRRQTFQLVV